MQDLVELGAKDLNGALLLASGKRELMMVEKLLELGANDLDGALKQSLNCKKKPRKFFTS